MLWEGNHSKLVFFPKMWPDLTSFDLLISIMEFQLKPSGEKLVPNVTKTGSNNADDHQESIEKIKRFNNECEFNQDQMIIDGKGFKKEIPSFEDRHP